MRSSVWSSVFFSNICTINHLLTAFWLICALFSEWILSFFLDKNAPKKDREFCKQMRKWVQSFDTTVITFAKPGFRHFVTGCFPLRLNYRRVYVVIERELQRKPLLHKVFILHPLFISLCNNRQFIWQHKIKIKVIFLIKQLIYNL